jgi:hypothetical protein
MAAAEQSGTRTWLDVVHEVQLEICAFFDIPANEGLLMIRASPFADSDPRLKETSFYRKFNRAKRCSVALGTNANDSKVALVGVDDLQHAISQPFKSKKKLQLFIAGSMT